MTKKNTVMDTLDNFFDTIKEKECVIALYDATGKKLGYVADTAKENMFDEEGIFDLGNPSITEDKSKALRVKWTKDDEDTNYWLKVKDELIEGCDLFHDLEFGAYLLELAD
jgi:hypothetical protein